MGSGDREKAVIGGVLLMLCAGLLFFTIVILLCVAFWPAHEKLFVLFAGILGNFNGSLMTYLQVRRSEGKTE